MHQFVRLLQQGLGYGKFGSIFEPQNPPPICCDRGTRVREACARHWPSSVWTASSDSVAAAQGKKRGLQNVGLLSLLDFSQLICPSSNAGRRVDAMSTASDEPPAPPRLPRAVSQATAPPRAWPASHVARCALKRGDRRVYFASLEGEVWRYDVVKDACDACWTSGRIVLALAHRGDVCLALERHATEIYLAAYDCSRSRVVGRQRRVGTGSDGSLSCTE